MDRLVGLLREHHQLMVGDDHVDVDFDCGAFSSLPLAGLEYSFPCARVFDQAE